MFFDVSVHIGTVLAVIVFFRKRLWRIIQDFFYGKPRIVLWVVLATIPAMIAGIFLDDMVETIFRNPKIVVFNLMFWGIVLWCADVYRKKTNKIVELENVGSWRSLLVGVAQAIALIPGTSRSGITITAGLFSKLTRRAALEFSFLMSIPVIVASVLLKGIVYIKNPVEFIGFAPLLTGVAASFASGLFALWILWRIAASYRFWPFALYRLLLGIILLVWLL